MKRSELKNKISEALTPDEAAKVDAMYNKIYKNGMLKDNPLKLSKYDNPDAIGAGKSVKLVQKESTKMTEKLGKNADVGDYIDDFRKSDAKQFQGKSKKKIDQMAKAAFLSQNKKIKEDNLEEEISDATFQKHADRVESLLRQLISATKEVDKSQDDTEDDVEELDQSIDYLASALTDKDPIDIAVDQATFGRLAKPTKEEINLEEIDAIMEEDELTKSEKNKLKKVSSQLKKSVKAHDRQSKIIDKANSETGEKIADVNMDNYKKSNMKGNRLTELVKAALMGPISEKQASTDKYDDNPALKGKQSELPDGLQKAIIKKKGGKVEEDKMTPEERAASMKEGEVTPSKLQTKQIATNVKNVPTFAAELARHINTTLGAENENTRKQIINNPNIQKIFTALKMLNKDIAQVLPTTNAVQNKSLSERILKELRGDINEMAGEDLELKSLAKKFIPILKKYGMKVDYETDTKSIEMKPKTGPQGVPAKLLIRKQDDGKGGQFGMLTVAVYWLELVSAKNDKRLGLKELDFVPPSPQTYDIADEMASKMYKELMAVVPKGKFEKIAPPKMNRWGNYLIHFRLKK